MTRSAFFTLTIMLVDATYFQAASKKKRRIVPSTLLPAQFVSVFYSLYQNIVAFSSVFPALIENRASIFKYHSTEMRNTSQWSSYIYDSITGDKDFNFWDCYAYCINRNDCDAFVFDRYKPKCYLGNLAANNQLFYEGPRTVQEMFVVSRRKFTSVPSKLFSFILLTLFNHTKTL